jgi:two-component system chemotaxis sensor kinase CheA
VRLEARRLDTLLELVGDLVVVRERLTRVLGARGVLDGEIHEVIDDAARAITTLQQEVLDARLLPVSFVFDRFPRLVRDVARTVGKSVHLVTEGRELALDRALLDAVGDPLVHLIRNAIDHGIEDPAVRLAAGKPQEGRLVLRAVRDGPAICIEVEDDGGGIARDRVVAAARARGLVLPAREALDDGAFDAEAFDDEALLDILAHPGFTTTSEVTTISGRGVGIDAVRARVRSLGGQLELHSEIGVGTRFTLRLPVTVAISRALVVEVAGEPFAIPVVQVEGTEPFVEAHALVRDGMPQVVVMEGLIPLVDLRVRWFGQPAEGEGRQLVRVAGGTRHAALVVEAVLGVQDIVVRPLASPDEASAPWWGGSTVLGDGRSARIVDLSGL